MKTCGLRGPVRLDEDWCELRVLELSARRIVEGTEGLREGGAFDWC